MKKAVLMVGAGLLAASGTAFGWGLSWESVTGMGREKIEPIAYNIEVSGNNLRVYEWITPTKPYQKCVFVASEQNTNFECSKITAQEANAMENNQ